MLSQPWHQLCTLREDVRTGRLTLDEFAADLNGVRTGEATVFFAHAYPLTNSMSWRGYAY